MSLVIRTEKIVFGINEILPLSNFPQGKKRIVLRPDDWARVYVKTTKGIIGYHIKEQDGKWIPYCKFSENRRI
jgi:hypothetical protein